MMDQFIPNPDHVHTLTTTTRHKQPEQELGVWEPYAVKVQTIKTAIEVRACARKRDTIMLCHGWSGVLNQ